jgi:hypothetical protein
MKKTEKDWLSTLIMPATMLQKGQAIYGRSQPENGAPSTLFVRLSIKELFLIWHGKRVPQEAEFQSSDQLLDTVVQIVAGIPPETLIATFHQSISWLQP